MRVLTAGNTSSLSVSFSFTMGPSQASAGGGFTFAVLSNSWKHSLALEFDVHKDKWDPDGNHAGINLGGGVESLFTAPVPFPLLSTSRTYVWMTYDKGYKNISVFVSRDETEPSTPLLSFAFSLCLLLRPQPISSLSEAYFIGFTMEGRTNLAISDLCISTGT